MNDLKTMGPKELGQLLGRATTTIRTDVSRKPQSLPPRLIIPGSSRLLWLESDVRAWLEQCRAAAKT